MLKWVVPQIVACMDDERIDVDRTINRIIHGVFHHPAQRTLGDDGAVDGRRLMFGVVEQWWRSKDRNEQQELRRQLSRDGVINGENHKEGVHDSGHGCGQPLGMAKISGAPSNPAASAVLGGLQSAFGGNSSGNSSGLGKFAEEAVGGGALGGLVGALGGSLLGAFSGEKKAFSSEGYTPQGGHQQQYTEVAHQGNQYAQAQFSETKLPGGGRQADFRQYEQQGRFGTGFEERIEQRPTYGGGYEQTNERRFEEPDGRVETETWREGRTADGRHYHEATVHRKSESGSDSESGGYGHKKHGKHHKKKHHGSGSDNEEERDRPQQYVPPGRGFEEPPRQRFEERRFEEPARERFEGRRFEEPPRERFEERRFEEPPRQEGFGSGGYGEQRYGEPQRERGFGGEFIEEPPRQGGFLGGGIGGFGGPELEEVVERFEERFEGGEERSSFGGRFGGEEDEERRDEYSERRW